MQTYQDESTGDNPVLTIERTKTGNLCWSVTCNGRVCERLAWEEMMRQVTEATHPGIQRFHYQVEPPKAIEREATAGFRTLSKNVPSHELVRVENALLRALRWFGPVPSAMSADDVLIEREALRNDLRDALEFLDRVK